MLNANKKRAFVAMSGGVDSSVAAWLLKNRGYDATGVFMRCYNLDGCSDHDAEDARRVAEKLEIPFYVWDFEEEYKARVVSYMIDGYRRGLTPNPDVMCNREIKFGIFFERALRAGADYVATGHYVRLGRIVSRNRGSSRSSGEPTAASRSDGSDRGRRPSPSELRELPQNNSPEATPGLFQAKDKNKDQSYFLWTLTQDKLRHCLFPIGDYLKAEVREMACKAGLHTADKKDSQGICFLGKITLADFLASHIPERSGGVFTVNGEKIGEHRGAQFYTIGQRHGLDLKTKNSELGVKGKRETRPHYIAEKNVATNTITVAEGMDNPALYRKEVFLSEVNFINPLPAAGNSLPVLARVRYRQPLAGARLERSGTIYKIIFSTPQKFVAPGQSAVFYSDYGEMLGGGVIS